MVNNNAAVILALGLHTKQTFVFFAWAKVAERTTFHVYPREPVESNAAGSPLLRAVETTGSIEYKKFCPVCPCQ